MPHPGLHHASVLSFNQPSQGHNLSWVDCDGEMEGEVEGVDVAEMDLVATQYCPSNFHLQYCWWNQYHLVEQRRMGVHEDYVALGVAIQ